MDYMRKIGICFIDMEKILFIFVVVYLLKGDYPSFIKRGK